MAKKETPMQATGECWDILINPPKEKATRETLEAYEISLLSYFDKTFIATNIHDKDTNKEGEPKTIHLHAVIDTPSKPTKKAFIEELACLLHINTEQISLIASNNDYLPVQYLIHANDKDKYQYEREMIKTNDSAELEKRLNKKYEKPKSDLDKLIEANSLTELAQKTDLTFANKYRAVFNQIKEEKRQDINGLKQRLDNARADIQQVIETLEPIMRNYGIFEMVPDTKDMLKLKALLEWLKSNW